MGQQDAGPVTEDRIERAMILCAYLVSRDDEGEVYAPILERLEAELEAFRRSETPRQRAQRLLRTHTMPQAQAALR